MIGVYKRVSTNQQTTASQSVDLDAWTERQDGKVKVYEDTGASGRKMSRPAFNRLMADVRAGKVKTIVVWRLDRLGRTVCGLANLFDELVNRDVNLISLRDGIDLATPTGRLVANVLASVAAYETEVLSERIRAGQEVARTKGRTWGGKEKGKQCKRVVGATKSIRTLLANGIGIAEIARSVGVSRGTVYAVKRGAA